MARVSERDLAQTAIVVSNMTGLRFAIQWAYGKPRLIQWLPTGGERDVSPRLPSGQLQDWMYAFIAGIDLGIKLR
jgi:hypothetical protein